MKFNEFELLWDIWLSHCSDKLNNKQFRVSKTLNKYNPVTLFKNNTNLKSSTDPKSSTDQKSSTDPSHPKWTEISD